MKRSKTNHKSPLKIHKYAIYGAILWTLLLSILLLLNIRLVKQEALNRAYIYTKVGFEKDVLYRRWVAEHGGVYVKVDGTTPPSPYLSHIPDRDIFIDSSLQFTLMNPAYMTRQVYELEEKISAVRGHITSLNALRPENAPDVWERGALQSFENGVDEVAQVSSINGKEYFRYMKPFITEQSCLKCHANQGYKLNDIRGGISVSYPLNQIYQLSESDSHYGLYIFIWIAGLIVIFATYNSVNKSDKKRLLAEEDLKQFNLDLKEKVEERSRELIKSRQDWENVFNSLGTPAQLIGKDHTVLYVNEETLSVFELERKDIIGKKCHVLFHNTSDAPQLCPLEKALKTGTSTKEEMIFEGQEKTYIVNCSPIFDSEGEIEYFMHIMTDISERKEMELRMKENQKNFENIFELSPDAINITSSDGTIKNCNMTLVKMLGYSNKEEIIGEHFTFLFSDKDLINAKTKENNARTKGGVLDEEHYLKRKDGSIFPVSISASNVKGEGVKPQYLIGAARDISELKQAENLIRESELRLKEAQKLAKMGNWDLDIVNNTLFWSDEIYRIFNLEPQAFASTYEAFLDNIHPDDREHVNAKYSESLKNKTPFDIDHRLLMKDGSIKYVNEFCETFYAEGKPIRSVGTVQDITERILIKKELTEYKEHLEELVKERTKEIAEKNEALERINKLFVGRENRMAELKEEIETLKNK